MENIMADNQAGGGERQVIRAADVATVTIGSDGQVIAAPIEKHPQLRALFNDLQEEKAAIQAKSAPLRKRYDELAAQIAPLETEQRAVAEQFIAIERPRLAEIDTQLSGLTRAMGGRRMSEPAEG
jgi:chromosome segregation ATPase